MTEERLQQLLDTTPPLIVVVPADGDVVVLIPAGCNDPGHHPYTKNPTLFAIVIADLVQHVANAYAPLGFDPTKLAAEIRRIVIAELTTNPTGKPRPWRPDEAA